MYAQANQEGNYTNKKDGSSAALLQLRKHQLRQFLQRLEHALPRHRDALEHRLALTLQLFRQIRNRHRIWQIALVELQHIRNRIEIQVVLFQMFLQVLHRFEIRIQPLFLRIRHEYHAVCALQNQLSARLIKHLSRHRVQVEACLESAHRSKVEWQEIEK